MESESDDDQPGPQIPISLLGGRGGSGRAGPAIPLLRDLELKREYAEDAAESDRSALRNERRAQKALEKQRLDELVPRAQAGTRERQLEKKADLASSNRNFAATKEGDGMPEVADGDLMGGDEDDLTSFKMRRMEMERQKSERELRREEVSRAKREEREQRQREFRDREEKTMQGFIELAKRRFG
ncbi:MAG: hypothetical protein LQ340_006767 [Diploschistes diacapsis]|nr:MAG: hypothetical protein LQ340_006767 [Diploschistes diacapsis]